MNNKLSSNNNLSHKIARSNLRAISSLSNKYWNKLWKREAPHFLLVLITTVTSLVMALPLFYVVYRSFFAGKDRWMRLLDTRIPSLLNNTLSLTIVVTFSATVIGVLLAFLVERCELPGKKMWQWLLALPLVIPPYVGAVTYIIVMGPRGWLFQWLGQSPFNIYSFWGVAFVLTMFTYPYVFLITSSAIKKMNANYENAARSLGLSTGEILLKVSLPLLRPAIGAGAILVALYVLSDFGAVAMLRYTTFTSAIYYQMGSYDNLSATVLSMVFIILTIGILFLESKTKGKQRYVQMSSTFKQVDILELKGFKIPAIIFIFLIFGLSFLLPITVLLYWARQGVMLGALDSRFWVYALNSIKVSSIAAIASMVLSLPIVYMKSRYPSRYTTIIDKLSYSGYSLPGVIVALGIIFLFNQYIPWLYGSYILISVAYIIRFLPQSLQGGESSLSLVSPRIDEGARSLGYPSWKVLFKVILPLIAPGVLAGGALVFVSSLKELPATLILRPPGFDTLAVRVWVDAGESLYHMAAPASLFLILVSLIPLKWMLNKY
ncbi:iron(III) transport system permease protein [Anaerobranca californiensis DSM 14826]|uniref:Iron(III) transport system permease protein n=1 Tax=Anaerobranca californiensis DSM 14826 TaxID=1120989 RepID=A0A1M6NY65_9FIRM|nr:iron ABC transporter permease [Anaerobranca californiensis]SHK00626.1 iron(III) transport system permease protein [Anaerobranca californiensis DSM 14826]